MSNSLGNTIYYKVGTGTQQTYTAPFQVNQSDAGVLGTNILVTYWSTGEAEKSITYDTSGSVPSKPVATTISGNWYARVNWTATANTTSYTVFRSTTPGQIGEILLPSQYQTFVGYDDNEIPAMMLLIITPVRASNGENLTIAIKYYSNTNTQLLKTDMQILLSM